MKAFRSKHFVVWLDHPHIFLNQGKIDKMICTGLRDFENTFIDIIQKFDLDHEDCLTHSAYHGYAKVVNHLLKQGTDPDTLGSYPLYHAALKGNFEMVKDLVEHGAAITKKCILAAEENAQIRIWDYLRNHGV